MWNLERKKNSIFYVPKNILKNLRACHKVAQLEKRVSRGIEGFFRISLTKFN